MFLHKDFFRPLYRVVWFGVLIVAAGCGGGGGSQESSASAPSGSLERQTPAGPGQSHEPQAGAHEKPSTLAFDRADFELATYAGTIDLLRDEDGEYRSIVRIENRNDDMTRVVLGIAGRLFVDREDILEAIEQMSEQYPGEPDFRKAWRFVATRTYHATPFSAHSKQHDPLLYLNSIGSGFCDDAAAVLATIWQWQGHASRLWGLSGHVVAEVEYDGRLMMFDADYGVHYHDALHRIASVEQLAESPDLVHRPLDPVWSVDHPSYSESLAELYASVDDNFAVEWSQTASEHPLAVPLPPRSALTFPVVFDEPVLAYDGDVISRIGAGQIEVPAESETALHLPFVVLDVEGRGEVSIGGVSYEIGSKALRERIRRQATSTAPNGAPVTSITIRAVDPARVIFAMSPFVTDGSKDAHLTVWQRPEDASVYVSIDSNASANGIAPHSEALADASENGMGSPVTLRQALDRL